MRIIKIISINLGVLLFLLILIEIVFRVFRIAYDNYPMNTHSIFHHVNKPNYAFEAYDYYFEEFGGFEVRTDENGWRIGSKKQENRSEKPKFRAAFLGDSYTRAGEVPFDSSYFGILKNAYPDWEMTNYGVASYSTVIYYLQTKHLLANAENKPDVVFLELCYNDLPGDLEYLDLATFDEDSLVTKVNGGLRTEIRYFGRSFYLVRYLARGIPTFRRQPHLDTSHPEIRVAYNHSEFAEFEGSVSAFYVKKIVKLLDSQGIETYLMFIPSKMNHYLKDYSKEEISQKVERWAAKNEVNFIDLHTPFREFTLKNEEKLFYEIDPHLNCTGNRLVAKTITGSKALEPLRAPLTPEEELSPANTVETETGN